MPLAHCAWWESWPWSSAPLLGLALWRGDGWTERKVGLEVAFVMFAVALVACMSVVAAFTFAKVQDGRLDFFFCGVRTRSFALDGATTFELRRIGRMETLLVRRGSLQYVPNGALDKRAIVNLLRANGVAERQAD